MTFEGVIALCILGTATVLFVTKKLPIAVTALLIPVVLHATGLLPDPREAMAGFGNRAALAIAAIFVIGAGLKESGVATMIARFLQRVGGKSEGSLVLWIMVVCAVLSSVMSNVAVVAILLPVVITLSRRSGVLPSRLLIPLAFAAMLGGTITTIGTAPNFLIDDFLAAYVANGGEGAAFRLFDFAPVGLAITATGIGFMVLVGRHLLPSVSEEDRFASMALPEDVAQDFDIHRKLSKLILAEQSRIVGQTIEEASIRQRYGLSIVMIHRGAGVGAKWVHPNPDLVLQAEDRLYVQGEETDVWHLAEEELVTFGLPEPKALERILGRGGTFAEVALTPRSSALDRSFRGLDFRKRTGLNVISLVRHGRAIDDAPRNVRLRMGDSFIVTGTAENVRRLAASPDYIVLTDQSEVEDLRKAPLAIALLLGALIPPILGLTHLSVSALAAAVLMFATGCLSRGGLKQAIDWNVICLIIGTIPLGAALREHGVAELAADAIHMIGGGLGAPGVVALLFLISAVLAVLTSNAAAAVIVAPVALEAAVGAGLPLRNLLMAVAYGASCAFLLPFAQCNILVMGPGGYTTRDFVKLGLWASLVMAVTTIAMLSL